MKLFYYQRPDRQPNFGDELNSWLWPKLCSLLFNRNFTKDVFNEDDSTAFVGMGTLLNNKLAERVKPAKNVVIFSTGVGYEQPIQQIPDSWHMSCVRGPLSAKRLGLPPSLAIADGGLLIAKLFKAPPKKTSINSFMPHIHSATAGAESCQRICQQANIRYIDPRWPIEEVLQAIGSSELLLAEAMHGAIAADALRVPWIPVVTSPRIYAFKWQDWCASMKLPYSPYRLPSLTAYPRWGRGVRSGSVAAWHWLNAGFEGTVATVEYSLFGSEEALAKQLTKISRQAPFLSRDRIFQQRLEALQTCFTQVIRRRQKI